MERYKCPSTSASPTACSGSSTEQYSYEGQTSCSACPAGYECPNTKTMPSLCSLGFYSLEGDGECTQCPAGYSCPKLNESPAACATGYYSLAGSAYCQICPLGYYCLYQTESPIKCPDGTYSGQGSSSCLSCPKGKFCPSTKVPQPYDCPPGFYSNLENQVSCTACPAGYSCAVPADDPNPCDEGKYSFGASATCSKCPAGYYCPKNNKQPIVCPAGTHSQAGQSECLACTDGHSCLSSNSISDQNTCGSGQYRVNNGGRTICRDCPPGHYCPSGSSQPIKCQSGTYALYNSTSCTACTAGHFCPSLADSAQTCPPGTYQPDAQKTFCYECPPGYYCASATISTPVKCAAGTFSPYGNATACLTCPEGFYCPENTIEPLICPSGYYSSSSSAQCTLCESGYACPSIYESDKYSCPSNSYSYDGQTYCFECPIGMSCNLTNAVLEVEPCPFGYYSDAGQSTCTVCPAGKSCHTMDSQGIINCEAGFYSLDGEIICKPCPAGFMCPNVDGTDITECDAGFFSPIASTKCYQCPRGYYCPYKHVAFIERCPPGTYSTGNQSYCVECPENFECPHRDSLFTLDDGYFSPKGTGVALRCRAGWECKQTGLEIYVRPCEPGYFSDTGASECTICPVGSYCPLADGIPLICPAGFYQDEEGQTTCKKCEPGYYTLSGNNTQCTAIENGTEFLFGGFLSSQKCKYGTYSNQVNLDNDELVVCQDCEPGTICGKGEVDPADADDCASGFWCNQISEIGSKYAKWPCPSGFYASGNTNAKTREEACTPCPAGYYCEGADRDMELCLPGYYCPPQTNRSTEYPCPAGTYQPDYGKNSEESCSVCPTTYYCPEGTANPILCPPGTICNETGIREYQQVPCPAGQYNPYVGQTTCITCPTGSYCPSGSAYPQLCPPGTYNDQTGMKVRTDCTTCPDNYLCTVFGLTSYNSASQPSIEAGYLSPAGTQYGQQLPCPPGTQDEDYILTDPDQCSTCPQGYACEAGTALASYTRKKITCEPGYYCPAGTLHDKQYPCPGGTYSAAHNLISASQCLTCPAGYFCPPGSYQPYICPNGYYCTAGTENFQHSPCKNGTYSYKKGLTAASQCEACPIGYFCKEFTIFPEICPRGTYNDGVGAYLADNSQVQNVTSCKICSAGYKCPYEGMTSQIICPTGTYSPPGSTDCFDCQEGHDCSSGTGLTMLTYKYNTPCPDGYYCVGSLKMPCPAGYFCPSQARMMYNCPVGTYLSTTQKRDVSQCITVPAGYYTDKRGSTSYLANLCALGWYCPAGSSSQFAYRCPRGTYANTTGHSVCTQCPAGYFCNETYIHPVICPQGRYCPAGTYEPILCPNGTFGAALGYSSISQCQACSPGQYCSQWGLSSPDGLCDPGYYCKGGAKVPNPTDGVTGDICQKGGYCEIGSKRVKECPPGTYNNNTKGKTQSDCIACPPGYYCSGTNLPTPSGLCQAGYYCPSGSTVSTQNPASPGYYTLAGASQPTPCDVGYYNPFTARNSCLPCRAGFYCDTQGISDQIIDCPRGQYCPQNSSAGTKCPIGTFNNQFNAKSSSDCKTCLPGKYCATIGLIEPTGDCEQGYYCIQGAVSSTPQVENALKTYGPCPAGYYCPVSTSYPIPCPAGTFSSATQAFSIQTCQACTRGYYCALAGLSLPSGPCDAGFYCPPGQKSPRPALYYCTPGQYCPAKSGTPTTVPAGYYQNMPYQSTYFQCPKGYYCEEGSTTYVGKICPAGYYCPAGTTYNTSYPCPAGTYQPYTGQEKCVDCDPGSFCGQQGLSAVSGPCAGGYYCKAGSTTDTPTTTASSGKNVGGICLRGYYCPEGSAFMRPCTPGMYCGRVGLSAPSGLCSAGYYCTSQAYKETPLSSSDGGNICPPGFYCPSGSEVPLPCPVGTYSSLTGNIHFNNCSSCPAGFYCDSSGLTAPSGQCARGYYCPAGSKTPRNPNYICPRGYKCPLGSATPTQCDLFTYQDVMGNDTCKLCLQGYQCNSTSMWLCGPQFYCPAAQARQACPAGKFNMKYNASSISECVSCLPGFYCQADSTLGIVIQSCPAGVYCQSEAKDLSGNGPCPIGYYCPAQTSQPRGCPPGKYCDVTGLTTYAGLCDAGYYCIQNSTTNQPMDGIQGDVCPRGFYCPQGSFTPIACPIGTYNSQTGSTSLNDCTQCPSGFLCNERGAENYDSDCPAGYYCIENNQHIDCPPGYYCPSRQKDPIKCPSGTYQPDSLQSSCLDCPPGFYCPQTPNATYAFVCPEGKYCEKNTEIPTPCPIGTFNPFLAQISLIEGCQDCSEGKYCDQTGLSQPSGNCAAGYFCKKAAPSATPIDSSNYKYYGLCLPGYYCPGNTGDMIPCPIGTYNNDAGSNSISSCKDCPEGFYCDQIGKTLSDYGINNGLHYCDDGMLCPGGAKSSSPSLNDNGVLCAIGHYCKYGQSNPCPTGRYQPNLGGKECLICPDGKLCNETGMSEPYNCPPGFYCQSDSQGDLLQQLIECPPGSYSEFIGNQQSSDCTTCREGKYCLGGSIQPHGDCAAQFYCGKGSSLQIPSNADYVMGGTSIIQGRCPAGYYCPTGTVAPLPCPIGTFNAFVQRDQCDPCPLGHYCDEKGLTDLTIRTKTCKPGYYCIQGASVPNPTDWVTGRLCRPGFYCTGSDEETPCAAGTYEPRNGSYKCQSCPQGYLCPLGSIQPVPCPVGYYCPINATVAIPCPDGKYGHTIKLYDSDQCAWCPAGKFCQSGFIQGDCAAGFYCDVGATAYYDFDKLCPQNHYCYSGTLYPKRCPNGGTTPNKGAKTAQECQQCQSGNYCLENGDQQYACPRGYYCAGDMIPTPCPKYKYNNLLGRESSQDCLNCPEGYYCNETGISDYKNYPCPRGYYCPGDPNRAPIACPAGTYNQLAGKANLTDCLPCPEGSYCPLATIFPIVCKNGTYCPMNSTKTKTCEQGFYCPTETGNHSQCPAAFYCPTTGSDQYKKCENGTYCLTESKAPVICPSGFYGSSNPNNVNQTMGCTTCDAGYYSLNGQDCQPCTKGYVCLGNTTSDKPTSISKQGGYICPMGYYCPQGSSVPKACPRGTYGGSTGLASLSDCQQCPSNTYGDTVGLGSCKKCSGYTNSLPGASSCTCIGSNRVYLAESQQCVCKTGYTPAETTSSDNSQVDCTQIVYEKCTDGKVQDYLGNCKSSDDCKSECNGGSGTISAGIGICQCDNQTSAIDICDSSCMAKRKQVTFTADGKLSVYDPVTKITSTISNLTGVEGGSSITCSQADTSMCQLVSISKKTNGDFAADFTIPTTVTSALTNDTSSKKRRILSSEIHKWDDYRGYNDDEFTRHFKYNRKRSLQTTSNSNTAYIANPIICLTEGSALLFENISKDRYPVYVANSLINTNSDFDYSQFSLLASKLQSGKNITQFIFTFQDSGIYMFADSSDSSKTTVVSVMSQSQKCPSGFIYESKTQANLLKVGIAIKKDIIFSPDWGFFIGIVAAVLGLILISVFMVGYVYRKSWALKAYKQINYQNKNYELIKIEDPEDQDAIISINADSQAFQFLNEGKNIARTREQLRAKKEQEHEDEERIKKEKKQRKNQLDLEEVENLKEKLNKHVIEIKKLFGVVQEEDEDGGILENDEELRAKRLLDQILKLKDIIDENRRVLEGDSLDDDSEEEKKRREQELKDQEEEERKRKAEEAQRLKDLEYLKQQESKQKKVQENIEKKKDEVLGMVEKNLDQRKSDLLEKMQKMGVNISKEEQERMLEQFDQNLGKIGAILDDDEQFQQDLLKKKLEDRKNRRKKLQDKLQEKEKVLEKATKEYDEKKEDVEQEYQERLESLDQDIIKERKDKKKIIEEDLEQLKKDKLQHFEDMIKESKNNKDFGKILDQYQQASKDVDQELEKERQKQELDLERALKNRKGQRKAQLEKEKAEKLKALQSDFEAQTAEEKKQIDDIKNLIQMDDGTKDMGKVLEKTIEKIKANANQKTDTQEQLEQSLRDQDKNSDLFGRLKKGLMSKMEKMMNQHRQERREMERKMQDETKKLDEEVEKAKEAVTEQLAQEIQQRDAIKEKLQNLDPEIDQDERKRLMDELKQREEEIQKRLDQQNADQDNSLQEKLKARRKKKKELAEKEREMKSRHIQEREFEENILSMDDKQKKAQEDRDKLEQIINEVKFNIPQEDLPFVIQKALDEKQEAELNNLLVELFELKCRELQDEVFNLLEEKLQKEADIKKEAQDKIEVLEKFEQATNDPEIKEKLNQQKEQVKLQEQKDLQQLDWDYKAKEKELEKQVSERLMEKENQRMNWLKEQQLQEKKEIFDQHLPKNSTVKDILQELTQQEEEDLKNFKADQEAEKQRKIGELEKQQEAIAKEMQEQKERLAQMEKLNQKLEEEDKRRQNDLIRRKRLQEANMNSNQYIEKLKKDLEKINEQIDSAISQEKARQLQLMQQALKVKVEEAEKLKREEEEQLRLLEEAEKQRLAEEERKKKETEERMSQFKQRIEDMRQIIDKKKYCGKTQPESKNEYYVLMMRRKEKQMISRLQNQMKSPGNAAASGLINTLANLQPAFNSNNNKGSLDINMMGDNQVSKEQQLKLLHEILNKIESMELKVKKQLQETRSQMPQKNQNTSNSKIKVQDDTLNMSRKFSSKDNSMFNKTSSKSILNSMKKNMKMNEIK